MYQMYQPRHMQMPVYQNQYVNQPQNFIKCQPVSSIEEARAAMIEFDGSVTVFTDFAKQKIYTKQIDLNGMAVLNIYELKSPEAQGKSLEARVEELEALVTELKEGRNESNAITGNTKPGKRKSNADDGADTR